MGSESNAPLLEPGTVVRDTYTIDRLLGQGNFGDVYLARHRFMGMHAMKVFRKPALETEAGADALREAFLLSTLGHPNIVRVFEANVLDKELGGREYLTMEFVDGTTLDEYRRLHHNITIRRCLEIVCQLAAAVAQAHAQQPPILHRDIKPANVLVAEDDSGRPHVKLGDFGVAVRAQADRRADGGGTLLYMAPENFDGFTEPASDVWSLGMVLFELLCGFLPYPSTLLDGKFTWAELTNALRSALKQPFRPPSFFRTDVPPELDELVLSALHIEPQDRITDGIRFFDVVQTYRLRTGGAPHRAATPPSEAATLVARAYELARQAASLPLAIDMLEQAIALDPGIQPEHETQLGLWRRGIAFLA